MKRWSCFFWASSCFIHCLAALDFRAGVEQPFGYLIVQNRQAVQSMGRSDWTLEDNMVDGLFFCATLTGHKALVTGRITAISNNLYKQSNAPLYGAMNVLNHFH